MGFLYHAINIPKAITITFLLNIFSHARFVLIGALSHLGLYKPPPEQEENNNSSSSSANYILLVDPLSPSFVPVSIHVITRAIKSKVPILKYQEYLSSSSSSTSSSSSEEKKVCSICLECIEMSDEVRELASCAHLFHRECLDTWVDEGQYTCPLCRSMLLPARDILGSSRRCCGRVSQSGGGGDAQLVTT